MYLFFWLLLLNFISMFSILLMLMFVILFSVWVKVGTVTSIESCRVILLFCFVLGWSLLRNNSIWFLLCSPSHYWFHMILSMPLCLSNFFFLLLIIFIFMNLLDILIMFSFFCIYKWLTYLNWIISLQISEYVDF